MSDWEEEQRRQLEDLLSAEAVSSGPEPIPVESGPVPKAEIVHAFMVEHGHEVSREQLDELCKKLSVKALLALESIVSDEDSSPSVRLKAVGHILDRGYGKATQSLEVSGSIESRNRLEVISLDGDVLRRVLEGEVLGES